MTKLSTIVRQMSHIEFFGPPGAGKSLLYEKSIANVDRFCHFNPFPSFNRIAQIFPDQVQNIYYKSQIKYWRLRLREKYAVKYLCQQPKIYDLLKYVSKNTPPTSLITTLLIETISFLQLGIEKVEKDEIIALDEGFAQRCLGVLYLDSCTDFSVDQFVQLMPNPAVAVYVDAPSKVCRERQVNRGRIVSTQNNISPEQELDLIRDHCESISQTLENKGINVINITNMGDPDRNSSILTKQISDELDNYQF